MASSSRTGVCKATSCAKPSSEYDVSLERTTSSPEGGKGFNVFQPMFKLSFFTLFMKIKGGEVERTGIIFLTFSSRMGANDLVWCRRSRSERPMACIGVMEDPEDRRPGGRDKQMHISKFNDVLPRISFPLNGCAAIIYSLPTLRTLVFNTSV